MAISSIRALRIFPLHITKNKVDFRHAEQVVLELSRPEGFQLSNLISTTVVPSLPLPYILGEFVSKTISPKRITLQFKDQTPPTGNKKCIDIVLDTLRALNPPDRPDLIDHLLAENEQQYLQGNLPPPCEPWVSPKAPRTPLG